MDILAVITTVVIFMGSAAVVAARTRCYAAEISDEEGEQVCHPCRASLEANQRRYY